MGEKDNLAKSRRIARIPRFYSAIDRRRLSLKSRGASFGHCHLRDRDFRCARCFRARERISWFPANIQAAQHGRRRLSEQGKAAAQGFHIYQTFFFVRITPSRAM